MIIHLPNPNQTIIHLLAFQSNSKPKPLTPTLHPPKQTPAIPNSIILNLQYEPKPELQRPSPNRRCSFLQHRAKKPLQQRSLVLLTSLLLSSSSIFPAFSFNPAPHKFSPKKVFWQQEPKIFIISTTRPRKIFQIFNSNSKYTRKSFNQKFLIPK